MDDEREPSDESRRRFDADARFARVSRRSVDEIASRIEAGFDVDIVSTERSLERLDDRLFLAKKLLHRLRHAVVNNFYHAKKYSLTTEDVRNEISTTKDPDAKEEVRSLLTNAQNRIHPPVKRILNEKYDAVTYTPPSPRPLRKKPRTDSNDDAFNDTITLPTHLKIETFDSRIGVEAECSNNMGNQNEKIPMYVKPQGLDNRVLEIDPVSRNKQKGKFRIIIGNTSKYIKSSSPEDLVTHRWLLYVRGPPNKPDISHIIDSITVQLHDSYAPQNIIKLTSSPFHLSKRGWGEFPVKLRLFFKNGTLNKPVNLIHQLKLDRYHTGIQTLGGETVADIWLYTDETILDTNLDDSCMLNSNENNHVSLDKHLIQKNGINDFEKNNVNKFNIKSDFTWEQFAQKPTLDCNKTIINSNCDDVCKIKEEPMELDNSFENEETNAFINYDCSNSNNQLDINKSDMTNSSENLESSGYDINSISPLVMNAHRVLNENEDSYSLQDSLLLNHIYLDHTYFKNTIFLQEKNNMHSIIQPFDRFERNVMMELQNIIDFSDILEVYKKFNVDITDDSAVDLEKIVEFNKVVIKNIFDNKDLSKIKKISVIKNIIMINNVIMKQCVKQLSDLLHKVLIISKETIDNYFDILESTIYISDEISNIASILQISSDSITLQSLTMNDNIILIGKTILNIIGNFWKDIISIRDIRCVINYMLKKMPMIDSLAHIAEFKQFFPYVCSNSETYFSFDTIKRRNLLWTRSKIINNFLRNYFLINKINMNIWSTKQILMFSQYHGYLPVKSKVINSNEEGSFEHKTSIKELFESVSQINTKTSLDILDNKKLEFLKTKNENKDLCVPDYSHHIITNRDGDFYYISDSSDDEIDICNVLEKGERKRNSCENSKALKSSSLRFIPLKDDTEKDMCNFIEKSCTKMGLELKSQNIGYGYICSLTHKLILSAVKSFIEDLLRRSLCIKIEVLMNSHETVNIKESTRDNKKLNTLLSCNTSGVALDSRVIETHLYHKKEDGSFDNENSVNSVINNANEEKLHGKLWNISESGHTLDISLKHIFEALKTRNEFDFLTNKGLGLKSVDYSGEL